MFKKIFSLFAALTLSVGLWAEGSVFTYTATKKLETQFNKLGTVVTHEFNNGAGTVTYSGTVTEIGAEAFNMCSSLQSITIPEGVTTIGEKAFFMCGSLQSVTIPASVTTIGAYAFYYCGSLLSVTLPEGLLTIGDYAFRSSSLTSITIPNSVTTIGVAAFNDCKSLTSITIPNSVTEIEEGTFASCSSLQAITIPTSVTTIGKTAFAASGLTSITIPTSVTSIGENAFGYCDGLASVTFEGNACQDAIGELAFNEVGKDAPALLTLHGTWAKENQPDEDGNWYGGKFELSSDPTALPTLFGDGVKGNKFLHNGQLIIRKDNKTYNALGQEL